MFKIWSKAQWFLVGMGLFALILMPSFSENYEIRKWMDILTIAILAMSWNFIGGLTGYPSFAPAAFFGLGAYVTAIFMNAGFNFFLTLAIGSVFGGLIALLIGIPILRLRGHYFAIATFGVAEFFRELAENLRITGGGDGINLPQITGGPDYFTRFFYFSMLGVAVLTFLVQYFVTRHRLGYGLVAIRENEDAAAMTGIDTRKYKVIAFVLSSIFPAMGGGVYAYRAAFLEPIDVFDILFSIKAIVMAMLGGVGTVMGPLVGSFLLEYLTDYLWSAFTEFHSLFLGLFIVLIVLFLPRGLMSLFQELRLKGLRSLGTTLRSNIQRYRV
jgi:branched-chain amino acid transport system permease protein